MKPLLPAAPASSSAPAVSGAAPPDSWRKQTSRLIPALAAVLCVATLLASVEAYTRAQLHRHLDAFSYRMSPAKLSGNVLQTAAFQATDELPIFGSSELNRPAANRPDEFFRRRPTGFAAFPIGRGGNSCLILTQKIGAVGMAARGKKVAIFLSPSWFLKDQVTVGAVRGNLAPLQLGSWVFGGDLSVPLKQRIARRLLDYPQAVDEQPLLETALRSLADGSSVGQVKLAALRPLGWGQNFVLERLDYCALLREMVMFHNHRPPSTEPKRDSPGPEAAIPWDALAAEAETHDRKRDSGNDYSVGAPTLEIGEHPPKPSAKHKATAKRQIEPNEENDEEAVPAEPSASKPKPVRNRDAEFIEKMTQSKEWVDLSLLLQTLKETGAKPLFISQPFDGIYRDRTGISASARRAYYDKLHSVIDPTGYPLVDFSEHEQDKFFFNDPGHPGSKAWIYYNHALADFYASAR